MLWNTLEIEANFRDAMKKRDSVNSLISDMSFDEYELDVDQRSVELFEEKDNPLHKVICIICELCMQAQGLYMCEHQRLDKKFNLYLSGQRTFNVYKYSLHTHCRNLYILNFYYLNLFNLVVEGTSMEIYVTQSF